MAWELVVRSCPIAWRNRVADAILDRLIHNAHRLTLKGDSMRKTTAKLTALDQAAAT